METKKELQRQITGLNNTISGYQDMYNQCAAHYKDACDIIRKKDAEIIEQSKTIQRFLDTIQKLQSDVCQSNENTKTLEEILNCVVHTTFENNQCFDIVVFQKHGKPPVIYKNGILKDTKNAREVNMWFDTHIDGGWESTVVQIEEE